MSYTYEQLMKDKKSGLIKPSVATEVIKPSVATEVMTCAKNVMM
jgi:hypothetical protein